MNRLTAANNKIIRLSIVALVLAMLAACGARETNDFPPPPTTIAGPNIPPTQRPPDPARPTMTDMPATAMPTPQLFTRPPSVVPTIPPTALAGLPSELTLIGFYDPQDQAAAAVEFRRRLARFERETNVKVVYESKPRTDVDIVVRTYLMAGATLDLGPVLPEDLGDLIKAGILAQLDRLAPNQRWPQQSSAADRACVIQGKRYCVVDDQGMAWIVPKNAPNPPGAIRMLAILVAEQ
jgi:ABC-type glycerol-3-phosphate transport system substrate-binding protein